MSSRTDINAIKYKKCENDPIPIRSEFRFISAKCLDPLPKLVYKNLKAFIVAISNQQNIQISSVFFKNVLSKSLLAYRFLENENF